MLLRYTWGYLINLLTCFDIKDWKDWKTVTIVHPSAARHSRVLASSGMSSTTKVIWYRCNGALQFWRHFLRLVSSPALANRWSECSTGSRRLFKQIRAGKLSKFILASFENLLHILSTCSNKPFTRSVVHWDLSWGKREREYVHK